MVDILAQMEKTIQSGENNHFCLFLTALSFQALPYYDAPMDRNPASFGKGKKVYMVGIKGTGMAALAEMQMQMPRGKKRK